MISPAPGSSEPNHNPPALLEVDDEIDEAYASEDEATLTSSVTSSIRAYRQENGRTYHAYKDGNYLIPNDEFENNRLDFQHAMFLRTLCEKLHIALIPKDPQNVLDIGTGTGIWAIDFADEYPSARVVGTDLSNPTWHCYDNIKPGGYLEMQDIDYSVRSDDGTASPTAIMKWANLLIQAYEKLGAPANIAASYKKLMGEARFVDVVEIVHKWPINTWPKSPEYKELGMWQYTDVLQGMQGFTMAPFTRELGWSPEEVEVFLVDVRNDLKSRKIHAYSPIYFIYGRKPEN